MTSRARGSTREQEEGVNHHRADELQRERQSLGDDSRAGLAAAAGAAAQTRGRGEMEERLLCHTTRNERGSHQLCGFCRERFLGSRGQQLGILMRKLEEEERWRWFDGSRCALVTDLDRNR